MADIVIIGAATSGAYFAAEMAKRGYDVLMIERLSKEKLGTRMDIFHVSKSDFDKFKMPRVKQGDPEWAFEFTDNGFSSPSNTIKINTKVETVGLHMHEYVALMVKNALSNGARIAYDAEFTGFLFEGGKISGVRYRQDGEEKTESAKTVVDCSGMAAVGRHALPDSYGMEKFDLAEDEKFYVVLRYAKFPKPQGNTFWLNTKSWYAPFSMNESEKIIGTGAVNSFDNAYSVIEKLDKVGSPDKFEVVRTEKGATPYRRPPYSLVADNFIAAGDAACLTKPDCGEGVTSSMVMMDIAIPVLDLALKCGDTSRRALWKINREYNRVQGADFCVVRAFLTKVIKASDDEIEYCFKNKIIFCDEILGGGKLTAGVILNNLGGIVKALAKKNISKKTMLGVLEGAKLGLALRSLYMNFPETEDGFESFCKKADALWKKVGKPE